MAKDSEVNKNKELVAQPMSVGDLAKAVDVSAVALITFLLRRGIVANLNQVLERDVVELVAQEHGFSLVEPAGVEQDSGVAQAKARAQEGGGDRRLPVVVVVGHVDHGKTTLLDFIRKTRVVAREKGGITQHLGAYKAKTDHGDVVFLDTPGHEAFSLVRVRGVRAADIAILVVAADDGIMPQTIESINAIKKSGLPVIVAINKVDKATPKQVEQVKHQLAQHDLLPQEWGGQIECVEIAAVSGKGVDDLLELVTLQAEVMELQAKKTGNAVGYILESHVQKGRGPVATVICQEGLLKVGDHFVCGDMHGRISSLTDFQGKRIKAALPSEPVLVAGFPKIARVGDMFRVADYKDIKRGRVKAIESVAPSRVMDVSGDNVVKIIVKADTVSSKEALLLAIENLGKKESCNFVIVSAGVGPVAESDVTMALDTGSIIYTFGVGVEAKAAVLASKKAVTIKYYDIIYKLLDDLQELAIKGRPVEMVQKKTGQAVVLKVFDIKKIGVIAGARVSSGILVRDGKLVVYRGRKKVGSGKIVSLQRDRKTVKEVHAGYECAFMIEDFTDWQVDDRVECYQEVPA